MRSEGSNRQAWAVIAVILLGVGVGVFRMSEGWPSGVGSCILVLGVGALLLAGAWEDIA
jgi:hypothetical protein